MTPLEFVGVILAVLLAVSYISLFVFIAPTIAELCFTTFCFLFSPRETGAETRARWEPIIREAYRRKKAREGQIT